MEDPSGLPAYDAVVLTGGTARRLGGADKATLEYAGRSLLEHALTAVSGARRVVVVGPAIPTTASVRFAREEPPGGGPGAGLMAGLAELGTAPAAWVVVLAVDMPRVTAATVARLRSAADGHDGAFLADPEGRRQLAGVVATTALAGARPDDPNGVPLRRLLDPLDLVLVHAQGDEARDVDTWADLD